nr:DUF61 family protein [Staphylothermus hellenicus]
MSDHFNDLIMRALSEELRIVNKHLVYRKKSLCDLLSMDIPYLVLRDGSKSLVDRRELILLKNLVEGDPCKLMLPIIIEYNPSLGKSAYVVRDEIAAKALSKLLSLKYENGPLILYRPQLYMVRLKLRTVTTIIFIPSSPS